MKSFSFLRSSRSSLGVGAVVLMVCEVFSIHSFERWARAEKKKDKNEVQPLRLASMLIRDGHYDRAAGVLSKVDPMRKNLDLGRFHLLKGIVSVKRGDPKGAMRELEQAVRLGQNDQRVHLLLAQSRFHEKQYRRALGSLKRAGEQAKKLPGGFLLKAQCHWRLGHLKEAWQALDAGRGRFPKDRELLRQETLVLLEMGLASRATRVGHKYLALGNSTQEDYLALAEALRKAGQPRQGAVVLEEACLRFPNDNKILTALARCYLDSEHPYTAATLLHRASYLAPDLRVEAAELYRRAGRLTTALLVNAQIVDQKKKTRQRLGLFIEMGRFEEAVSLSSRLWRLGLMSDEQVIYGVAFAYFRIGQFAVARKLLKEITKTAIFDKAMELRRVMISCLSRGWSCVP